MLGLEEVSGGDTRTKPQREGRRGVPRSTLVGWVGNALSFTSRKEVNMPICPRCFQEKPLQDYDFRVFVVPIHRDGLDYHTIKGVTLCKGCFYEVDRTLNFVNFVSSEREKVKKDAETKLQSRFEPVPEEYRPSLELPGRRKAKASSNPRGTGDTPEESKTG